MKREHTATRWTYRSSCLAAMICAMAWVTGCTSHKVETKHEVEPIHITVDVNLKIDRALDEYFEDVDNTEVDTDSNGE